MFDKINVAQLYCYLAEIDWSELESYAQKFVGPEIEEKVQGDFSFVLVGKNVIFRAEQFVLNKDQLPWEIEVSLTLRRQELPFDDWLNVQFSRDLAQSLDGISYCELPEELQLDSSGGYMLQFDAEGNHLFTSLVELDDYDTEWVEVLARSPIDLRNLELYQSRLPY